MVHQSPCLILHNARIFTVEADQPWEQAVALHHNQIQAVGNNSEILALAGPSTHVLNAKGRLILPGLCDAHIHFYDWSLGRRQVGLAGCTSKADMLTRIQARAESTVGSQPLPWLTGQGWNESHWVDATLPSRYDLDPVTGKQPAIFWRSDMHAAVVNSAALEQAAISRATPDPAGGLIDRDPAGEPTGLLRELAIHLVRRHIAEPAEGDLDNALREGIAKLHSLGITAIHDQRMKCHADGTHALAAYQRLSAQGQLTLRVNCNIAAHDLDHLAALGLRYGFGNNRLRLGHIKIFSDGSLGSRTAWMLAPYLQSSPHESDNRGVNVTSPADMAAQIRRAAALGFPVSIHAIGDRANRVVLDVMEEVAENSPRPPVAHRIEHVQIIDPTDLPRLARLNITASVQPIHITDDMETADRLLGARTAHMYNFRSLRATGALLALGSDAPVSDPNPFLGFHAALTRQQVAQLPAPPWHGSECLSLTEVVYGYTKGAALAAGWEPLIGSIRPGKRADLIVLDRDLFKLVEDGVRGDEVADTRVEMTIFDGEIVHAV